MGQSCWDIYWRVGDSVVNLITENVLNSEQVLVNIMFEFYALANNVLVFFADFFFEDWLSLAFYVGDVVFRLIVVQH